MVYKGVIEGIGVNLRSLEEKDAEFTFEIRQDKERTMYVHAVEGTVEDQRIYIRNQRAKDDDYYFLVEDKEGTPLGAVAYYNIIGKNGEMGRMVINGSYAQNCDAILQLRRFVFEIIGADYARCTVVNGNKSVLAQIKRLGGIQTGTFIDEIDGSEVLEFKVTRQEYLKRKDKYQKLVEKAYLIL